MSFSGHPPPNGHPFSVRTTRRSSCTRIEGPERAHIYLPFKIVAGRTRPFASRVLRTLNTFRAKLGIHNSFPGGELLSFSGHLSTQRAPSLGEILRDPRGGLLAQELRALNEHTRSKSLLGVPGPFPPECFER